MQTWETLAVPTAQRANDMKKVFPQGYVVPHSDVFNLNDAVHGKPGPRRIYFGTLVPRQDVEGEIVCYKSWCLQVQHLLEIFH